MGDQNDSDNKLTDLFKKVVSTGIGAAFMTEEALKSKLGDLPIPKEFVSNLLSSAKTSRDELIKSIKNEVKNYIGGIDVSKEIQNIVEKYDIEVNATFKFRPKKESKKTTKK